MSPLLSHFFGKPKPAYNFHNDESLHDNTTHEALPWYSNLGGDALAVIKNIPVIREQGAEQGAKHIAGSLDLEDPLSQKISKTLVTKLWGSMLHPPVSYRGLEYRYRQADGSHNSVLYPQLGKAGLPYAKTVPSKRAMLGARPDPGDLFDLLMARKDDGVESKSGISMMLLYHATLIIHDIFRTDDKDSNASVTSSYLDLAPLYGSDIATQKTIRQMRDGLLKPDTFAERRLLNQPPGVCILLISYSRFHNYVAQQLKEINEHGRFSLPPGCDGSEEARADPKWKKAFEEQDEHLFQTARLVTCGMYINIAIHDYLRCLMGVHELDTPWTLDPRKPYPEKDNKRGLDRGEGNMVSCEFNLLYRFHSPISKRDAKWAEELFVSFLENNEEGPRKLTAEQIKNGEIPLARFAELKQYEMSKPAEDRPFFPEGLDRVGAGTGFRFTRDPNTHKFDDAQLAAELCRAIEDPICQFGAQQVPKVFRTIEVMGILQARKWEVATLNEFREFFGMSRFQSFEEINDDPEIAGHLRDLYEDPDLVELYPGLFCEGKGRCLDPGAPMPQDAASSLWRGVFSDAVTLVRSDRFYTLDWNVDTLTAWGMKEVESDPKINKGSVMSRLFERAFPGCFAYNSVHMWQPFYTPSKNIELAQAQGYLNFLDLSGLEDNTGKPHPFVNTDNEVVYGQSKQRYSSWKSDITQRGVRRTLERRVPDDGWRGGEFVMIEPEPLEVTSYKTITGEILGGPNSKNWANPMSVVPSDIPSGPLRDIMTKQWSGWSEAVRIVGENLPKDWEQTFMDYFVGLAQDIRLREQRAFQKQADGQVYQLDVVKDLAIPVVTRFVADLIGFWSDIKTPEFLNRKYNENEIYQHIDNCQNFEAYDSDPTKSWKRRIAFQQSIKVLKDLAESGVDYNSRRFLEGFVYTRSYGSAQDGKHVHELRKVGVELTQALLRKFHNPQQVSAVMLFTALETVQRFVLTFTESLAYFVDPTQHKHWCIDATDKQTQRWKEFKTLAWNDTVDAGSVKGVRTAPQGQGRHNDVNITTRLQQYVLEASRLSNKMDISRVFKPADKNINEIEIILSNGKKETVTRGQTVLLNLRESYSDPASGMSKPTDFQLRDLSAYVGFGPTVSTTDSTKKVPPTFSKRATLIGLTGLLKHCAHLSELRVAHDKAGRVKRVTTPNGFQRYASPQWDLLKAYPTTWNVRYDGVGTKIYTGADNADQGRGQNQIFEYESKSLLDDADSWTLAKLPPSVVTDQKAIDAQIDAAVTKAVADALAKIIVTASPPPPPPVLQLTKTRPQVYAREVAADSDGS